MELRVLDIIVLVLAVGQIIETYHHGGIFAGTRSSMQMRTGVLAELLDCMFCLSHWVSLFLVSTYMICTYVLVMYTEGWSTLCFILQVPIYSLAVTRGAQLLNDLTHARNRTPKA